MQHKQIAGIRRVAADQRGLFTLTQALETGWDRSTLRRWHRAGVVHEVAPRVYRFGAARPTWDDKLLAAVLSADAVAARRSAAALYGLLPPPAIPQVLVARGRRNLERVELHSTDDLPSSDVTRVGPIPTTTPVRTIIDVAAALRQPRVEDLVDRAITRRLVRPTELEHRARDLRAPARAGAARVLCALANIHPDLQSARNEWEARVLRLAEQYGLPAPTPNLPVMLQEGRRVLDVAWPEVQIDVEFDGYLPHTETRSTFEDDRVRQNALVQAGWTVFRLTASMVRKDGRRHFAPVARAVVAAHESQNLRSSA